MTDFIPTTGEVLRAWLEGVSAIALPDKAWIQMLSPWDDDKVFAEQFDMLASAAFARWLAEHDREVAEKAWDTGFVAGWHESQESGAFVNDVWDAKTPNPFWKAKESE